MQKPGSKICDENCKDYKVFGWCFEHHGLRKAKSWQKERLKKLLLGWIWHIWPRMVIRVNPPVCFVIVDGFFQNSIAHSDWAIEVKSTSHGIDKKVAYK